MAVDIARLVVESDTSDLKKGQADLNAFGSEAEKTSGKLSLLDKFLGQFGKTSKAAAGSIQSTNLACAEGDVELNKLTNALLKNAAAWKNDKRAMDEAAQGVQKLAAGQQKLQKTLAAAVGGNTRGAAQANRFNSANMLAQFQDIAVTSAMGMNPMLIAMQQGTQLQYILAQSNAPLKDFVAGLKSAFSVSGLLTIGLTGLVATLIQVVDWSKVGSTALNILADVFNGLAYISPVLITALTTLTVTLAVLNRTAIASAITSLYSLAKTFTLAAYSATVAAVKMAAAWVIAMGPIGWITAGVTALTTATVLYFTKSDDKSVFQRIGDYFTGLANKIGNVKEALKESENALTNWLKTLNKEKEKIEDKKFEDSIKGLTLYEQEYQKKVRELTKLANEAKGKGIIMSPEVESEIKALAKENALIEKQRDDLEKSKKITEENARAVERLAEAWNNLNTSAQQKLEDLTTKRSLIGAGTYESVYTQTLTDLTRQAEGAGIALTPEKSEQLEKYAENTARLSVEVEKLSSKYDLAKSSVKSFFSDMRQGLKEGESAWESFGNAVLNTLDKIIDKAMDFGVDMLFMAGRSYFGGNISSGSTWNPATSAPAVKPTVMAANGGVFSNGVYSSPTVFQFAKGGKFGVMGEAGPEAVMPLTRGPDGSLGVRADNAGNSSPVIVNVINNSTAQAHVEQRQTSQGVELDVIIDQLVAEKMNKPGTSSNTALRAFSNQKLIAR